MGEAIEAEIWTSRFPISWYLYLINDVLSGIMSLMLLDELLDAADAARKKYKKDLDQLKPDLAAYTRQKEAALGLVPGALAKASSSKDIAAIVSASSSSSVAQRLASEDLYRDANTLQYGDNKPSEDAIDRVVSKLNNEYVIRFCFFLPNYSEYTTR